MGGRGSFSYTGSGNDGALGSSGFSQEAYMSLDPDQRAAVDAYVEDAHGEVGNVRKVQQGKKIGSEQEKYKEMGELLERLIAENKTEYDTIYRGISIDPKLLPQYKEGYVFDQMGTSSWSGSDGKALEYAFRNDIQGTPVMFISYGGKNAAPIGHISSLNEDEYLVSKSQKFRVTWADDVYIRGYNQNVRVIEVEEV